MIIKRERGQERQEKRTVGKREPGTRPRIKKEETTLGDQGRKPFSRRNDSKDLPSGKRVGKTKVLKTASGTKPKTTGSGRLLKERTSDVFRRNVIEKRPERKFEGADSDQYLNKTGKVLRGKFGKQNLNDEFKSTHRPLKSGQTKRNQAQCV